MNTTTMQRKMIGIATALGLVLACNAAQAEVAVKRNINKPKAQKQVAVEQQKDARKDSGDAHLDYVKGVQYISLSGPTKRTEKDSGDAHLDY